jgi:hypothetical protein
MGHWLKCAYVILALVLAAPALAGPCYKVLSAQDETLYQDEIPPIPLAGPEYEAQREALRSRGEFLQWFDAVGCASIRRGRFEPVNQMSASDILNANHAEQAARAAGAGSLADQLERSGVVVGAEGASGGYGGGLGGLASGASAQRYVGPRGGVYHYSASGNKVYEKRK